MTNSTSAALCLAVELSLFCLVLFTEWKSSKVLAQSLQSTNHSPLFNQTDRKRPTRMYYQVGSCLYSCNHNLLLRKRLWPQSMVSITVPVLHQSHISVRKIYKNKWKILLFQVNHFPPIGHYCTQRGWKRNVCALPRTEMHFCKSWFAPSKLYLYHNFDEIYPSRYPSQRSFKLFRHLFSYDITILCLFSIV